MKGLLKAFGLIAALFISNSHAIGFATSIYDNVSYSSPKTDSSSLYRCSYYTTTPLGQSIVVSDIQSCFSHIKYINDYADNIRNTSCFLQGETSVHCSYESLSGSNWSSVSARVRGTYVYQNDETSKICPPDESPLYIFSFDYDLDGEIDRCYNPSELDNQSKCADLFNSGSILTAGVNASALVCKTFEDGSRCAFSRVDQGSTPYYQPNLEKGCFGDAEQIPDYDNDNPPSPQPEQCTPYFGGFACAADPKNYCSSTGVCVDGCGYVNGQFICFRDEECKGASCEPAPVNCETVPDSPICKDKETIPEPTFCEKNPIVESCQSGSDFCKKNPLSPSCQLGGDGTGSGGSKFVLDYDKLIQGMKDAAKTLIDPNSIPDNTAMDKSLDDENKAIKSDYDNFLNDGVFSEIRNTSQRPIFSSLETLFPTGSGTCSFNFGKFSIEICSTAEKLREILYWVFSILTLIYLRHLFYQTIRTSAGK